MCLKGVRILRDTPQNTVNQVLGDAPPKHSKSGPVRYPPKHSKSGPGRHPQNTVIQVLGDTPQNTANQVLGDAPQNTANQVPGDAPQNQRIKSHTTCTKLTEAGSRRPDFAESLCERSVMATLRFS